MVPVELLAYVDDDKSPAQYTLDTLARTVAHSENVLGKVAALKVTSARHGLAHRAPPGPHAGGQAGGWADGRTEHAQALRTNLDVELAAVLGTDPVGAGANAMHTGSSTAPMSG